MRLLWGTTACTLTPVFTLLPLACRVVNALGAGHMDMPLVQPSGHA
jgi:hypothetical protein